MSAHMNDKVIIRGLLEAQLETLRKRHAGAEKAVRDQNKPQRASVNGMITASMKEAYMRNKAAGVTAWAAQIAEIEGVIARL